MEFKILENKIIKKIENKEDKLIFECLHSTYRMYHQQDCCEDVQIEDIAGDLNDLLNSPILFAEEVSSSSRTDDGSSTWTFYKLSTIKGSVTIRWYGTSNGYYSEAVTFEEYSGENND